jgi:hypothetical protein
MLDFDKDHLMTSILLVDDGHEASNSKRMQHHGEVIVIWHGKCLTGCPEFRIGARRCGGGITAG